MESMARFPDRLSAALSTSMQTSASELARYVQDNELSGQMLADKTGLLKSSIMSAVSQSGEGVAASVSVDGDVPYAAIQEYGGQTKAHIIEAANGKALAFNWLGKRAFFVRINHPGSNIPARPYLETALADQSEAILSGMEDALAQAIAT